MNLKNIFVVLLLFPISQGAKFTNIMRDGDTVKSMIKELLGQIDVKKLKEGSATLKLFGSELKQKPSMPDPMGNSHTRFDQSFGGIRVVGKQLIFHQRNGDKANHVANKGGWKENGNGNDGKKNPVETFFTCLREVKGKNPSNPILNAKQLKRVEKCIDDSKNSNRKKFKPSKDWSPPKPSMFFSGNFIDDLKGDLPESFNPDDFDVPGKIKEVKKKLKSKGIKTIDKDDHDVGELVIFIDENDGDKAKLAFKVNILGQKDNGTYSQPEYYIDALTGDTLSEIESLNSVEYSEVGTGPGGNGKIGKYKFGGGKDKLLVAVDGNKCSFDTPYVKTVNLGGSNDVYATEDAHSFDCYESSGDETYGSYSPMNDAHFYALQTLKMYAQWFGEDHPSVPLPLLIKVHLGDWSGHYDGRQIVFGDKKSNAYPASAADIVSHEIGHMVTAYASKLEYSGASGALNEAFSDWAGKALQFYMNNNKVDHWKIGKDVIKSGSPDALRCLDKPTCDGNSIDHVSKFSSSMKVHYASGIFNKAFYTMAQKFKHTVWDMFDILYHANAHYWQEDETLTGAAEGVLAATEDLKSGSSDSGSYWLDTQDVVDGFKAVGIKCAQSSGNWACST